MLLSIKYIYKKSLGNAVNCHTRADGVQNDFISIEQYWTELLITFGIISTGLLMFKLAIIHLPAFIEEEKSVLEGILAGMPQHIEEALEVNPIEETT
ncbi:hypothetical protein ACFLYW_01480 [Thermodesulfobacteriota bacterium]